MQDVCVKFRGDIRALNWSQRGDDQGLRLAISSNSEGPGGCVVLIEVNPRETINTLTYYLPLNLRRTVDDLAFIYNQGNQYPDLLATASDKLRLWQIDGDLIRFRHEFPNIFPPNDNIFVERIEWNTVVPWRLAALSSVGTGVVWNLEEVRKEALMEPDDQDDCFIQDFSWGGPDVLAVAYDDGYLHIADLRTRPRMNQMYYSSRGSHHIGRVEWNDLFPNYLALTLGGAEVVVVDPRRPGREVTDMDPHGGREVLGMAWDTAKGTRICTAGRDSGLAVFDIPAQGGSSSTMIADYAAETDPMMKLKWALMEPDWLAYTCGNSLLLKEVVEVLDDDEFY